MHACGLLCRLGQGRILDIRPTRGRLGPLQGNDSVAPIGLGLVKGFIGRMDDVLQKKIIPRGEPFGGDFRKADAGRNGHFFITHRNGGARNGKANTLTGGKSGPHARACKEKDEFFAAKSPHNVR